MVFYGIQGCFACSLPFQALFSLYIYAHFVTTVEFYHGNFAILYNIYTTNLLWWSFTMEKSYYYNNYM